MAAADLTRETLDATPARVLTFLRAVGTSLGIRRLLATKGFLPADHREGWALLHAVSGLVASDVPDETDSAVLDATTTLDNLDEDLYLTTRAALERKHPEQAAFALHGLAPSTGAGAILSVKNLLDRFDVLEKGRSAKTKKADQSAINTLAIHSIDARERARLRQLISVAESASEVAPLPDNPIPEEQHLADLIALRAWYEQWSALARVAIKRKDYLIRLGLASRKKADKAAKTAPAPATPAVK